MTMVTILQSIREGRTDAPNEVRALDVENGVYKLTLKRYNSTKDLPDVYMTSDRIDSGYSFSETESLSYQSTDRRFRDAQLMLHERWVD